jgi:DNA polymerase III gamma/tau subunit
MYQVIARKYRPQTFQDVVNQEHVKTTFSPASAAPEKLPSRAFWRAV